MNVPRRGFLEGALGCATYLALAPATALRTFAATAYGEVVAEEAFARIEVVADGVWAVISTPLRDGGRHFTTTANGGIVAGRDGVLVVEGFYSDEGAAWLSGRVRELTGREPTHAVVTHYHADHTRGLGGLSAGRPEASPSLALLATPATRDLLVEQKEKVIPDTSIADEGMTIDLGDRSVRLVPRRGHTASDVTVELNDPKVIWCGDLVWNGMFPNYVDAIPSHLARHCEAILGRSDTAYVPGHGDRAAAAALDAYLGLIRDVEQSARRAVEQGRPAAAAAAEYRLPESLAAWTLFSPSYFERAFQAWENELVER
jgi:glyoxylase-like metal-dependent hydrolase (beta-lactamase superfamily II)